jgi:hypothetical protein
MGLGRREILLIRVVIDFFATEARRVQRGEMAALCRGAATSISRFHAVGF